MDKPTPTERGGGSIMYVKNTLNPIERKSSATCTGEIIQVDINPKNAVHLKLLLIYRNTRITAADDDEFYAMLEEILPSQHECVIMGDFNLLNIDWTLQKPTPAPGNTPMQLLADNNLTQHVHENTRQNNILDLVISAEEEHLPTEHYNIRWQGLDIISTPPVHRCGGRELKAPSLVWGPLFLLSGGPKVVWWSILLRKRHSWALSSTVSSVVSSLVSLSLDVIHWTSRLLSFCVRFLVLTHMVVWSFGCVSSISKDGCGYYCSKIKHNFSFSNPTGIISGVLAVRFCNCHSQGCSTPWYGKLLSISITPFCLRCMRS